MPEDFKMTTTNKTGDIQNGQEEETIICVTHKKTRFRQEGNLRCTSKEKRLVEAGFSRIIVIPPHKRVSIRIKLNTRITSNKINSPVF